MSVQSNRKRGARAAGKGGGKAPQGRAKNLIKERTVFIHGANLASKEKHRTKYRDAKSREYLEQIRPKYDEWRRQNLDIVGPAAEATTEDKKIVEKRVALFNEYKDFLDQRAYAEKFDSRSNLHSSALEEFMYYLFKDLVASFGKHALIGKSHTFKDLFFLPPNYSEMLRLPSGKLETKDHDFVIGATLEATLRSTTPPENDDNPGEAVTIQAREPEDYNEPAIRGNTETHLFDIPIIAVECKTYLDKTMLEGSSRAAEDLKARSPNGMYIVVMEWLKLTGAINLRKLKVNQIYVLRKQKNTDREFRYKEGYVKNPIDPGVVWHLFDNVRNHLTTDWGGTIGEGLERGYLI